MVTININKALRIKNTITANIKDIRGKIAKHNSYVALENSDGSKQNPDYDILELLAELADETEKLVILKDILANASGPVRHKIYTLSELKSAAAMYRALPIKSTEVPYRGDMLVYTNQISQKERDKMLKRTEKEIEILQDEITTFNYNTKVEIQFSV